MQPDRRVEPADEGGSALGVGQVRRLLILRTFPAYSPLAPDELAVIAAYTRERLYDAGEYLSRIGQRSASIHFVVRGAVELRRNGRTIRRLGPKSVVGGLSLLAREEQSYDVVAATETLALQLRADDAFDIFEDHFPVIRSALRAVGTEVLGIRKRTGTDAGYAEPETADCGYSDRPLDLVQRMAQLRRSISFAQSRLAAIAELAREAEEERHGRGTTLFSEGERIDAFYVVVSGIVGCASEETGQRFRFGSGDAVGALDAVSGQPRWYTATAETDLVVLRIDCETLFDIFEDHFDMAMDVVAMMARSILAFYDEAAAAAPSDGGPGGAEGGEA